MQPITVKLLGVPEVRIGERAVSFRTRKVLAMFVYLAVDRGTHSRDELMALLWPESGPANAASTLRVSLSRLRQALQDVGDVLSTEEGRVTLNPAIDIELDVDWLAAAAEGDSQTGALEAVQAFDRGEFLEGFSLPDAPDFERWTAIRRAAYLRQLEKVYDRHSQHLLANHNSAAAVETAARWVMRLPLSERAYRRLMAAQALNDQRPAALLTFKKLQETLQQELGVEPGRETAALAKSIELGRVAAERPVPPATGDRRPGKERPERLILPLAGRSNEHRQLVEAFHRAGSKQGQVVALIGAAGVGKSRLFSAFRDWVLLEAPGTEVWQGQAFETGGQLAYQPVVEALRTRLEGVNAPEDLLDDVWLAELSQLMPELRARYPDLPLPLTGDAHFVRARLFEALVNLGNALAANHPAVFILDDLQWADADTLDLVHYLARRWTETDVPVLLLLAIRQEAYATDGSLREWLSSLGRDAPVTRLLLDNLGSTDIEQLVSHMAGETVNERTRSDFATWLWAETRGLPFFIEALLQMLVERDVLPVAGEGRTIYNFAAALTHIGSMAQVPLPPGVREVIQARLAQHSKEEGALLLAAAVMGRACSFERLCQVADLSETEALEALETLVNGRLLTERPSERRPYLPAHDYIREVVYTESREARRRVFHRRALLALEAAAAPAAECAFHALAALLDEPAFRYSVAAGHEAFATYATQEALGHFNKARDAANRMRERGETIDANILGRLFQERGQALVLVSADEAAETNYEAMRVFAVQRQDRAMELAASLSLSNLYGQYTSLFNPGKAGETAQKALALARELGDKAAEARSLWGLMVVEVTANGDINRGKSYGQQALALARELGLKELVGHILNGFCWPLFYSNQVEQAREALGEAQSIWRELGNLQRLAEASRFMAMVNHSIGDHRRVVAEAPALLELSASISSHFDMAQAATYLSSAHARQGRLAQGLAYAEKVGDLSAAIGHAMDEQIHQYVRIQLYMAAGAWAEANRWADRLYDQRDGLVPAARQLHLAFVALAWIASGKLGEAQAILDEQLAQLWQEGAATFTIIPVAIGYAQLNLALGKPEALFAGLEEQIRAYRVAGFVRLLADENLLRGRAEMAMGHHEAAREAFLTAKEAAEAQSERAVLWQILVSLAEVEAARGDPSAANGLRAQAREVVGYIAEHAGELKGVFLAQPEVAYLLEEV